MRHGSRLAFAAAVMLAVAACSPSAASSPPGGGAAGSISAKIGAVLSLTKGAAVYGTSQKNGLELAVKDVNAKGKVSIQLVIEDDASDPQQGITAFNKLINQDNVVAIIGPTLSNTAASTDPIAQQAGVPVLGVSNTAAGITAIGNFIYRDSLTEGQVIPQTIKQAAAKYSLKNVAVIYGQDDAFTKNGFDVFSKALAANNISVVDTETFSKGDKNFSAQLTKIIGLKPDAIVASALANEGTAIVSQARQLGFSGPIIGGNGFNSPAVIKNGGPAAEGLVVGAAWNSASASPENQAFLTAYQAAYGAPPDQFAAQAYSGVEILAAAIEAAGKAERDPIRVALATIKNLPVPLGSFSFTADRDADHPPVIQIVKNGKFQVLQ